MSANETLQEISTAIKFGDKTHARELLTPLLKESPSAEAWYLAAQVAESVDETKAALKQALDYDPEYTLARRALDALESTPAPSAPAEAAPPVQPESKPAPAPKRKPTVRREDGQTIYEEGVYEMLWNCKYCGTEKLLGKTHRHCPQCGAAQDPEWRYYPSDDEKIAVHDHVYVGADKTCSACGTLQAASAEFCTRCGAPMTDAAAAKVQAARVKGEGQAFSADDLSLRQQREFDSLTGRKSLASAVPKAGGMGRTGMIAIVLIGLAAVGFFLFSMFATRDATATATQFLWERTIVVEELGPVSGRADCGAVPLGAYNIDRRREQVSSRQVPDGEECTTRQVDQGDGTFRSERVCSPRYRSEPVYGDVCYFVVNQWARDREEVARGERGTAPAWPQVRLAREGTCVGCERLGARNEVYTVRFTEEDGNTFDCEMSTEFWQNTLEGAQFTLKVRRVGGQPLCESIGAGE